MYEFERETCFIFIREKLELQKIAYDKIDKDEIIKKVACDFGHFLISTRVECVHFDLANPEKRLYKTNMGLAPDMLIETMEQLYQRIIDSKK